jgi:hypothetical protein
MLGLPGRRTMSASWRRRGYPAAGCDSLPMLAAQTLNSMSAAADAVLGKILLRGSSGMQSAPRTEVGLVAAVTLGASTTLQRRGDGFWRHRHIA